MIDGKCFTNEWQALKRTQLGGCDPVLLEKTIHAFALLDALAGKGLDFIFKGGTSLLLRLPHIHRLSIDVDILCDQSMAELDALLIEVGRTRPFNGMTEDDRGSHRLPSRRHFKFFYVPLDDRHSMQFMKQVFDIGELFDSASDLSEVDTAYEAIFAAENSYRGNQFSLEQALQDGFDAAYCMTQVGFVGAPMDGRCELIDIGRRQLESHLVGVRFRCEDMKIAAAKTAFLTCSRNSGIDINAVRYDETRLPFLRNFAFPDDLAALRKLKAIPEAMWYWSLATRLMEGVSL